jgi:hypothetical protein
MLRRKTLSLEAILSSAQVTTMCRRYMTRYTPGQVLLAELRNGGRPVLVSDMSDLLDNRCLTRKRTSNTPVVSFNGPFSQNPEPAPWDTIGTIIHEITR